MMIELILMTTDFYPCHIFRDSREKNKHNPNGSFFLSDEQHEVDLYILSPLHTHTHRPFCPFCTCVLLLQFLFVLRWGYRVLALFVCDF